MASRLNPYLNFPGTAREAMEFYAEVFGGELTVSTFGELGSPDGPDVDKIMHAQLESPSGYTIMGADVPTGMDYEPAAGMTISLSGDDGDELHGYWDKLRDGGNVTMPLEKQVWGDEFGMCVDRFGVPWMVNITQAR
jgi:PhnB protein